MSYNIRSSIIISLCALSFIQLSIYACEEARVAEGELEINKQELLSTYFGDEISLEEPVDYHLPVPSYIGKDQLSGSSLSNEQANLGRVLFYDPILSTDQTISCASCHQQQHAFSDTDIVSKGVNGVTGRHSMRLVNTRYADELNFFWDERAASLAEQITEPIQDHNEMGFSGNDGDPNLEDLIDRLTKTDYYPILFEWAYGDASIDEARIQKSLASFIYSIQSFDSKYDEGRQQALNDRQNFANFSGEENLGKQLFVDAPQFDMNVSRIGGGLGCAGCHRPPEFDIDPNSRNNGVVGVVGDASSMDLTNLRSPSLRDLFNNQGQENGPFMHDGSLQTIDEVLEHYNAVNFVPQLDMRLHRMRNTQKRHLTETEKEAVIAFLKTLSGSSLYTDSRWSNPFKE
jgi:cytochrome c peroxidase